MRTVIGNNVFITMYNYSKQLSGAEYDILILEDKLENARERLICEREGIPFIRKSTPFTQKRGQRTTTCYIGVGPIDERGTQDILVDVMVINHPTEEFIRSEGRAWAFTKALNVLFSSPYLLKAFGIVDANAARQQFVDDFNAERNAEQISK